MKKFFYIGSRFITFLQGLWGIRYVDNFRTKYFKLFKTTTTIFVCTFTYRIYRWL